MLDDSILLIDTTKQETPRVEHDNPAGQLCRLYSTKKTGSSSNLASVDPFHL